MNFRNFLEANMGSYWYHGSPHAFQTFTDKNVGQGNDEHGMGIYFASTKKAAQQYAAPNGYIYSVRLKPNARIWDGKQRLNQKWIAQLIKASSSLEDKLTNWDENPNIAFQQALKVISSHPVVSNVLPSIANDFYNSPIEFVRTLVKMGCDGFIVDAQDGVQFLILNNPKAVQIVEARQLTGT